MNMIDYVKWRGDLSFKASPFNDIDAMILSQLAGIDYTGVVPGAATVKELDMKGLDKVPLSYVSKNTNIEIPEAKVDLEGTPSKAKLLKAVGESVRYKDILMSGFVRDTNDVEVKQFSAVTFFLSKRRRFIAYRGTDGSLTSWKENFYMAYKMPYPGVEDALTYLEKASKGLFVKCMTGGHSKGGNFSLYAGLAGDAKIRKKVEKIYLFDAPGFCEELTRFEEYEESERKIVSYMPKGAMVGRLLYHPTRYTIVESTGTGIGQHSMFTWQVEGTSFVTAESHDEFSDKMSGFVADWAKAVDRKDRPGKIEEVFNVLGKQGIEKPEDFASLSVRKYPGFFKDILSLSAENKELFINILKESVSPEILKGYLHLPERGKPARMKQGQGTEECEDVSRQ